MKTALSFLLVWVMGIWLLTWCSVDWLRASLHDANLSLDTWNEIQDDITIYLDETQTVLDLSGLDLSKIPDLCSLLPVEIQSQLSQLDLSNNKIQSVNQDLSCLQNLKWLDLSFNQITELVWLWNLPSLLDLRLAKNSIERLESEFFKQFPALQGLKLWYNKLKDVSALQQLKWLISLELQHNELASLLWLENLDKLERVKFEFNKLKEEQLKYLDKLKYIKEVSWWYNYFKEEILNNLKKQ